jgi:hypothetical protein
VKSWVAVAWGYLLPTLIENSIGGVSLLTAALNHAVVLADAGLFLFALRSSAFSFATADSPCFHSHSLCGVTCSGARLASSISTGAATSVPNWANSF